MTLKELSGVYYITNEIERIESDIEQTESEAQKITATLSTQPKGNGISDKVGNAASVIADLRTQLAIKYIERIQEKCKLYEYINSISDTLTRLIFQYRFIDCLTWNEVANKLGGNNTEKSVSIICYRYLKDHK